MSRTAVPPIVAPSAEERPAIAPLNAAGGPAAGPATALPAHRCPLCGGPNDCAAAASGRLDTPCWCAQEAFRGAFSAPLLARVPANEQRRACICRRCAAAGATPPLHAK